MSGNEAATGDEPTKEELTPPADIANYLDVKRIPAPWLKAGALQFPKKLPDDSDAARYDYVQSILAVFDARAKQVLVKEVQLKDKQITGDVEGYERGMKRLRAQKRELTESFVRLTHSWVTGYMRNGRSIAVGEESLARHMIAFPTLFALIHNGAKEPALHGLRIAMWIQGIRIGYRPMDGKQVLEDKDGVKDMDNTRKTRIYQIVSGVGVGTSAVLTAALLYYWMSDDAGDEDGADEEADKPTVAPAPEKKTEKMPTSIGPLPVAQ